MSLPYNKNLIPFAKELRSNATKQENRIWYDFLRYYPVRFQRQKAIGPFIADFYCHAAKLVIEIDGRQHHELQGKAYDSERDALLESYDLLLIRFTNSDVDYCFESVCRKIDEIVKTRI